MFASTFASGTDLAFSKCAAQEYIWRGFRSAQIKDDIMKRSLIALLTLVFVAGCASSPSGSQPAPSSMATYRADETHSPVEPIPSAMLHDAARNKDVEMAIAYPTKGTQPFPVIIFSHDYGLSKNAYTQMMEYWTGQGYVTISPNHADAGAMRGIIEQRRAEMEKQREEM